MEFKIGNVKVSNERTTVIAEAGVNHLGRDDYAMKLVDAAVSAGVDIIKFQTYKAEKLTTRNAPRFWSWEGEVKQEGSQFDSYSELDKFGKSQYRELASYCRSKLIEFMSTPFDIESVDLLLELGVNAFKIASCDITNNPLLKYVARSRKPVLLSTGASTVDEIHSAVNLLSENGVENLCIMHCTLCYPTKICDANLSALNHLKNEFPEVILGLSDHTLEPETPSYAVMLGARVIEKHFTFDKSLPLSADHWLSVDELGMKDLIKRVRDAELMYGIEKKVVLDCEILAKENARRSIVAKYDLEAGQVLSESDLEFKRPGNGISPSDLEKVLGKRLTTSIKLDEEIKWEFLD